MKQLYTADIGIDEVAVYTADICIDNVAVYCYVLVWMKQLYTADIGIDEVAVYYTADICIDNVAIYGICMDEAVILLILALMNHLPISSLVFHVCLCQGQFP